ncbi:MAG: hypothetical protein AAF587_40865 [Bacteroidota bacterium]
MKRSVIHLPKHDPELTEIISETLTLREEAEQKEQKLEQSLQAKPNPYLKDPEAAGTEDIPEQETFHPHIELVQVAQDTIHEHAPRTEEEILAKNTNYVFIFGYTGSGKSTVLTAINMYMRQHYRVILNQSENQEGIRLIHQMMRDIEQGFFPQATSIGQITEYDTAFRINGEDVNLTFLEMAGEDLKKVDVDTGEEGLPDSVKAYLNCPGISISFLIVADYERVIQRTEDKLILQFLSYLYNENIDLSRVGVILSKFDRGRTDANVEDVIQTYLPQVDKWLSSGDIAQPRVFPFSIGEIQTYQDQKDEISNVELEDCAEIVPWLHKVLCLPGSRTESKPESGGIRSFLKFLKR